MSIHDNFPARGSDRAPSLENALVGDLMRPGIISCGPKTDLTTVARMMAANHVHAVVVGRSERTGDGGERQSWGLITALDLVAAVLPGVGVADAGALASTEVVTVEASETLERAAQIMVEHQLSHLLVVSRSGPPIGVVSTLDVAGCVGWGEA